MSCEAGKHLYQRSNEVIYCTNCGDIKFLNMPTQTTPGPFEDAKKFFFKHGAFPRNNKKESKAALEKLFLNRTKEKHIQLDDVDWRNMEEYAMFMAIILVTREGGYSIEVKNAPSFLLQRVDFYLKCFQQSPKWEFYGLKVDQNKNRFVVSTKVGENTLFIHPDLETKPRVEERLARYDQACEILMKVTESFGIPLRKTLEEIRSTLIQEKFKTTSFPMALELARFEESHFAASIAIIMVSQLPKNLKIYTNDQAHQLFGKVLKDMGIFKDNELFGWQEVNHNRTALSIKNRGGGIAALCIVSIGSQKSEESLINKFKKACNHIIKQYYFIWFSDDLELFDETYCTLIADFKKEEVFQRMMKSCYQRQAIFRAFVSIFMVSGIVPIIETKHENPIEFIKGVSSYLKEFRSCTDFEWTMIDSECENELIIKHSSQLVVTLRVHSPEKKLGASDIVKALSEVYDKQRNVIAEENQKEMDAILKLCQEKLKPGGYFELSLMEYPRLQKDSFCMEHFLRRNGYWLSSKNFGHRYMITMPHSTS